MQFKWIISYWINTSFPTTLEYSNLSLIVKAKIIKLSNMIPLE